MDDESPAGRGRSRAICPTKLRQTACVANRAQPLGAGVFTGGKVRDEPPVQVLRSVEYCSRSHLNSSNTITHGHFARTSTERRTSSGSRVRNLRYRRCVGLSCVGANSARPVEAVRERPRATSEGDSIVGRPPNSAAHIGVAQTDVRSVEVRRLSRGRTAAIGVVLFVAYQAHSYLIADASIHTY